MASRAGTAVAGRIESGHSFQVSVVTLENAQRLVEAHLAKIEGEDVVVIASSTIERSFGWVFFYSTRELLETGKASSALAGNPPYIVSRATGAIVPTGTAHPLEYYLSTYAASLPQSGA